MDHTFPSIPIDLANRPELTHRRPCGDPQHLQRIIVESRRVRGVQEVERASVLASPTRSNAVTFSCTAESNDGECGRMFVDLLAHGQGGRPSTTAPRRISFVSAAVYLLFSIVI